jgi:hypothetical protein
VQFYVHVDRMTTRRRRYFLEVKSGPGPAATRRTRRVIIAELLELLGARPGEAIEEGYVEL